MLRCARALVLLGVLAAPLAARTAPAAAQTPTVRFASAMQGVEGRDDQVVVVVERTDLPVSRLLVRYRTQDGPAVAGSDYVPVAGTLVFEVGTRTSSFTVPLRDDEVVEQVEHLLVHLEASSGSGASARLTLLDDDQPPSFPSSSSSSSSSSDEAGSSTPAAPAPDPSTRSGAVAAPVPAPPPVVVASSAGARRPVVTRTRPRAAAARPAPRRIILQQTPTTPFELRPADGSAGALGPVTAVDPVLALVAGLLLARVAAEVWFRVRLAAG